MPALKVRREGDRCLILDVGETMDEKVGLQCLALAERLRALKLPGVQDIIASYLNVAIHYEPCAELGADPVATLVSHAQTLIADTNTQATSVSGRRITVPVCYDEKHGPDLHHASDLAGLSVKAFIKRHHSTPLRVFMLGFAPGQPYLGIHDETFALPRRDVPRTSLPAGSLAVANRQTTIYPNELPGGWHVIGAVPIPLFDPEADSPTLLLPGDEVIFKPISSKAFDAIRKNPASWRTDK